MIAKENVAQESGFTPGPWQADGSIVVGPGPCFIADCTDEGISDQDEANARLIAAAPDMLAALRRVESDLDGLDRADEEQVSEVTGRIWVEVRAAIAKATGGSA